jgi:hypothetical protein
MTEEGFHFEKISLPFHTTLEGLECRWDYHSRMMDVGIIAYTLKWFGGFVIMKNDNVNSLCS